MYSASTIASYIIYRETNCNRPVSNLRLQKLLYFVQAYFLFSTGESCFDDKICAWDFGPVVPSVYHEYKFYGNTSIPVPDHVVKFQTETEKLVNQALDQTAHFTTSQLVNITHHQAPWINAYSNEQDNTISPDSIKNFYKG